MSISSIPVDLLNPGQVFGCLGFMELAEVLLGDVRAGFDWSDSATVRFVMDAGASVDPFSAALEFLATAEVRACVPPDSDLSTERWKVAVEPVPEGAPYPIPLLGADTLPARLTAGKKSVTISSWGETRARQLIGTGRDNVKFWAGSGGYPGVALIRDALDAARDKVGEARSDPFAVSAPQSSSFRFDWRRDYIPLDIGFSLNAHAGMQPLGYPLVEILAVIGLSHARPRREDRLRYRYAIAGRESAHNDASVALLPPPALRAALSFAELPFATRRFTMHLDWPGQEGQARCITTVHEETTE